MRHTLQILVTAAALALTSLYAAAGEPPPPTREAQPMTDAFLKGRIVSAFAMNPHVSAFDLDVEVDRGVATLSGSVDDAVERDLAIEIARGIEGVVDVRSTIKAKAGSRAARESRRTVGQTVDDATVTATVKSRLLANQNTPGSSINVTTRRGVVTLTGTVETAAQKDLAGRIAANSQNVAAVHNELTVERR